MKVDNYYGAMRNTGVLAAVGAALSGLGNKKVSSLVREGKKLVRANKSRKRKRKVSRATKTEKALVKRVKKLEKQNNETLTRFIDRDEGSQSLYTTQGQKTYFSSYAYGLSAILDLINNAEVWDPATATFVSGAFSSGPEQKSFTIDNALLRVTATNTSTHPVKVRVFICTPKTSNINNINVDITPATADIVTDPLTMLATNLSYDINENTHLKRVWNFSRPKTVILQPGKSYTSVYRAKDIKWHDETQYSNFDRRLKAAIPMFEFTGLYGHRVESGAVTMTGPTDSRVTMSYIMEQRASYDGGVEALRMRCRQGSASGVVEGAFVNAMAVTPDMITNQRN